MMREPERGCEPNLRCRAGERFLGFARNDNRGLNCVTPIAMKKTYKSEIAGAMHEMMSDFHEIGIVPKSTMREFDELCLTPIEKLAPDEIKAVREGACASQTVFARYLGVTPDLVSQWERGERKPSGPALKLLNLVKNKGLDCIA